MSNLQIASEVPGLLLEERKALEAHKCPKIIEVKKSTIAQALLKAITEAFFNAGINAQSKEDIAMLVTKITEEVKENNARYSVEEVCHAIELGSKGKLGDFNSISVRQVINWIVGYNQQIRREAIAKENDFKAKQEKQRSEEEKAAGIKAFNDLILQTYANYCKGLLTEDYQVLASMYRHLDKAGFIAMPNTEKMVIHERVKIEYYQSQPKDQTFIEKLIMRNRGRNLKEIQETEIKYRAQSEALQVIFETWKKQNFKLEL